MAWTTRLAGVGCVGMLVLATGCAGDGGSAERPSLSTSVSPTRELPSPTRSPSRTEEPTEEASATRTAEATPTDGPESPDTSTASPTSRPTSAQPTSPRPSSTRPSPSPTKTSTTKEPAQTGSTEPEATPSSAPASSEPSEDASTDDGVPAWVWWLVAALVAAAIVVGALLVTRSRRRARWNEQLESARTETAWLARELLPQLKSTGSPEGAAGGWQVGVPRVAALEDQLTVLEGSAPTQGGGIEARGLRDAVRTARDRVVASTTDLSPGTTATGIDEAIALLESALAVGEAAQR